MEQALYTLLEQLSSPLVFYKALSGCVDQCLSFVLFLLVLSVLQFTTFWLPFGIFKLFLVIKWANMRIDWPLANMRRLTFGKNEDRLTFGKHEDRLTFYKHEDRLTFGKHEDRLTFYKLLFYTLESVYVINEHIKCHINECHKKNYMW